MQPKQKIAFIVNPVSGTKNKERVLEYIRTHTALANYEVQLYYTTGRGDATVAAKRFAAENYYMVVAIGGDGTVNEVAQGLLGSNTCMGIIPMGSGNGLARDLNLPMSYKKAVDMLLKGSLVTIDAGKLNGQYFFCTAGVGYDALVGNLFATAKKRGLATYAKVGLSTFFGYKPQEYTLLVNGETIAVKAFLITVANASQWGNNARIAPEADMTDGMFDVVVVSPFPMLASPALACRVFMRGMHRSRYMRTIRCNKLVIERKAEDYIHYDGEPGVMGTRLEFELQPAMLKVVTGR